jgi:hypothetical protein
MSDTPELALPGIRCAGASIWKMSEISRYRSLDALRGYVCRADLFKEHAGPSF